MHIEVWVLGCCEDKMPKHEPQSYFECCILVHHLLEGDQEEIVSHKFDLLYIPLMLLI